MILGSSAVTPRATWDGKALSPSLPWNWSPSCRSCSTTKCLMRSCAKPSNQVPNPEILQELEIAQDAWKHVCSMRANELAEEKALLAKTEGSDEDDEEASLNAGADTEQLLKMARKQPNTLAHGSEAYWRSVANSTVRMYCSFAREGDKSAIMNVVGGAQLEMGEVGKSALLVHLDTSLLGESQGPGQQERLRRNWKPDDVLLHGVYFDGFGFPS